MIVKDLTDEALVELLQKDGNARLFSILASRYEKMILTRCQSYLKGEEAAKDVAQEVLIKLYLQLPKFRKEARFSTWLYAIIHNTCIDHIRKAKKKITAITEQLAEVADKIADTEQPISPQLTEEILDELLNQITPEEKLILVLKYRNKQTIQDIHTTLGISESAVKMRLKRARSKITGLLKNRKNKDGFD